jgi:O-antigen ligase
VNKYSNLSILKEQNIYTQISKLDQPILWNILGSKLMIVVIFFLPFGGALQKSLGFDASKIFVILSTSFVIFWIFFKHHKKVNFPKIFTALIFYILIHTIFTYIFILQEGLTFGYLGYTVRGGLIVAQEAIGTTILRFGLFTSFGYALADCIDRKTFNSLLFAYGLGFVIANLLSGNIALYTNESRYTGALLDPNALGLSADIALFISIYIIIFNNATLFIKLVNIFIASFAFYTLIASGSRGALLGLITGLLIIILKISSINKRTTFLLSVIFIAIFGLIFGGMQYFDTFISRTNMSRIITDQGAGRLEIWGDYINNIEQYWLTGVGFGRELEVVKNTSNSNAIAHNTYLGVFVEFGIVGLFLFLVSILKLLKNLRIKNLNNINIIVIAIFVSWMVISFFLDTLALRESWMILGLTAAFDNHK